MFGMLIQSKRKQSHSRDRVNELDSLSWRCYKNLHETSYLFNPRCHAGKARAHQRAWIALQTATLRLILIKRFAFGVQSDVSSFLTSDKARRAASWSITGSSRNTASSSGSRAASSPILPRASAASMRAAISWPLSVNT